MIRLRSEHLYRKGEYDKIHFNFTNGFMADYTTWMKGYRIKVEGDNVYWVKQADYSNDYESFRKYLDTVFAYAGTLSLSKELKKVPVEDLQITQSYMPAQDIHILKNPANGKGNPWYSINFGERLRTPKLEFTRDQLARFDTE
nr:DUF4846 domain-containing protein [Thermosediminibacter oceani]